MKISDLSPQNQPPKNDPLTWKQAINLLRQCGLSCAFANRIVTDVYNRGHKAGATWMEGRVGDAWSDGYKEAVDRAESVLDEHPEAIEILKAVRHG